VAKTFFLAYYYGADARKIREIAPEISLEVAVVAYNKIKQRYSGRDGYLLRTRDFVREHGHVLDWFGRRRYIPKVWSHAKNIREEALREAANFLIQGPGASVIKIAMRRVWDALTREKLNAKLIMSIHDEVVLDVGEEHIDRAKEVLLSMTNDIMPIKLPVEVKVGKNWAQMEDL
jgi:DNA polymerase-1